ncbi:MAG: hypothetical protein WA174_06510 [Rhodoferax sp.]
MRTTIKISREKEIVVRPSLGGGGVDLTIFPAATVGSEYLQGVALTPDQCGALIFGIEQALETMAVRNAVQAAR